MWDWETRLAPRSISLVFASRGSCGGCAVRRVRAYIVMNGGEVVEGAEKLHRRRTLHATFGRVEFLAIGAIALFVHALLDM